MAELGMCDSAIVALANIVPQQQNINNLSPAGCLQASLSPLSSQGIENLNPSNNGFATYTTIEVSPGVFKEFPTTRIRRYVPKTTNSKRVKDCVTNPASPYVETPFTIQKYIQRDVEIPVERLRALCGEAAMVKASGANETSYNVPNTPSMNEVAEILKAEMRQLIKDLNSDISALILANKGWNKRVGNSNPQNIALYNANGTIRADGIARLLADMDLNETSGTPLLLGGDMFRTFQYNKAFSGLNANGIDFEKMDSLFQIPSFYDPTIDTDWGTNQMMAVAPGTMKLVTFTKNIGQFTKKLGTAEFGTFVLPEYPNLVFDLKVDSTSCSEAYQFFMSLTWDLFVSPSKFGALDTHRNVNGLFHYTGVTI